MARRSLTYVLAMRYWLAIQYAEQISNVILSRAELTSMTSAKRSPRLSQPSVSQPTSGVVQGVMSFAGRVSLVG